jgi:hypothetical protein
MTSYDKSSIVFDQWYCHVQQFQSQLIPDFQLSLADTQQFVYSKWTPGSAVDSESEKKTPEFSEVDLQDRRKRILWMRLPWAHVMRQRLVTEIVPPDYLLLDTAPNIGPLIAWWKLAKFKNCWNKRFITSEILTLLYQQLSNLLNSQRGMSGPRLKALSSNRWSGGGQPGQPGTTALTAPLYIIESHCTSLPVELEFSVTHSTSLRQTHS